MNNRNVRTEVPTEGQAADLGRRMVLRSALGLAGAFALGGCSTVTGGSGGSTSTAGAGSSASTASAAGLNARVTGGKISARWLGGGVMELATPDYKNIAYADAWIWSNAGWSRFSIEKPPEYATKEGFAQYVAGKHPDAVFVLLTHDHGDHMGDYFEMLKVLNAAGLPVMTTGQSDLMRKGLVGDFKNAGLDPAKIVANGGAAMNFGGTSKHGAMTARLVPAVHSTLLAYPAAGFMLDIGGMRVYISGDTDLFGDVKMLGERYQPNLAIVCVGDGPFTMGPEEAARACQWLGVSHAIPVHYAHNGLVRGVEAGEDFRRALAQIAPGIQAIVMKPGDARIIEVA